MRFKLNLLLIILFVWHSSYSQQVKSQLNDTLELKNYAIKVYTTNEGLPSNGTTSAITDKKGFLWVGTQNGLCRFDGYTFKTFVNVPGDTTSLTNNYVNALIQDKNGRIWVGTLDGLNVLDPLTEKFTRFSHHDERPRSLSNNKVWSLLADRDNNIWVGTDDGFDKFVEKSKDFDIFEPNASNPNAMKGKSVNSIIEDGANMLWLGNWSSGLNLFDKRNKRFVNFPQQQYPNQRNPNDVWTLCMDADHNIFVGTYWNGLFKFNTQKHTYTAFQCPDKENHAIFRILRLDNKFMLLCGNNGFYSINTTNGAWKQLANFTGFQQAGIYQDKTGIIWLCALNGLVKLDSKQYKFIFNPFAKTNRVVKSLAVKGDKIWLGTNNGLTVINPGQQSNTFLHSPNPKSIGSNEINKLYIDKEQKLWVLTEFGFDEYDDKTSTFIHHFHHSSLGSFFNEDVFRDILEVNPGEYYLATDAGLKIYNSHTNTFTHYYNQKDNLNSLSNNHLYTILKDADNKIWMGTEGGGLNRFDPVTKLFDRFQANDGKPGSISNNDIHGLFLDNDRNVWICTQDGLNKYVKKSNSFISYSKQNGFASNVFKQITADGNGNLWVVTETGVSAFNPRTMKIKNFDQGDGVFSNSVICKANKGQLYIAGNNGLVSFDPLHMNFNTIVPPVYISGLEVLGAPVEPGSKGILKLPIENTRQITLNYDQNEFSLEFVALNYTHTEKNSYAYKLEGFAKDWSYASGQPKATYTNLNPGTYTFRVKAANNDGTWNKQGATLTIVITPPWYLTWWAYIIYFSLAAGAVYGYIVYNDRQAKLKYEVKLTHIEAEKEKELHEKKLSFFTNISHEFRTPLTLIINLVKDILYAGTNNVDQQDLNTINRNAKRLLSLVDQLLLFRKADAGADEPNLSHFNIVTLCREVFLCFAHQAKTKQLELEFLCDSDNIQITADREKVEIILFNLLANAIKFTDDGGIIQLKLKGDDNFARIEIIDSGCGISEIAGDKLYNKFYQEHGYGKNGKGGLGIGLYLVKSYVEAHGGSIAYESELNKGTKFKVMLPVGAKEAHETIALEEQVDSSVFFKEIMDEQMEENSPEKLEQQEMPDAELTSEKKSMLVVEDNKEISGYIKQVFKSEYLVYGADDGETGYKMILEIMPDIIISDVMMPGMSGIELCNKVKENPELNHIPVILLTASTSPEIKLKGIEGGADDYISKPFETEVLMARVKGILKTRNNLQKYFFNEITLKSNNLKISQEYKDFLQKCLTIVEKHLNDNDFNIKTLASEIGMSHSNLYRKIKSISGQSANGFIRVIRLRKAAEIMLTTDCTVYEVAYKVGFNDLKYFREQFSKLFGVNPSDYIKKYRDSFHRDQNVVRHVQKTS